MKESRDIYMERVRQYYGEEYGEMKRCKEKDSPVQTLYDLYCFLRLSWWYDTAESEFQRQWVPTNPSYGQSDVTAMMVYDIFGGTIHKVKSYYGTDHYFNRIDGHDIDLARGYLDIIGKELSYEPSELICRDEMEKDIERKARYQKLIKYMNEKVKKYRK